MHRNTIEHSYEELREVVISVMLETCTNGAEKFDKILEKTAIELFKHEARAQGKSSIALGSTTQLSPGDADLALDIVWDLFRQGIITLGASAANPGWPWIRLSRFGDCALNQSPYRVHNKAGFVKALRSEVTDISPEAMVYYREAVGAFYMDCLLSACVTLSIAAESEFLRLLAVAKASESYGHAFSRIGDGMNIRTKIARFQDAIKPVLGLLPASATDELDNNFNLMQSLFRIARKESGQPSGAHPPPRDRVFVYLQLFIPFAEQLMQLRHQMSEPARPRLVRTT